MYFKICFSILFFAQEIRIKEGSEFVSKQLFDIIASNLS